MKQDIQNRVYIEQLMNTFYQKLIEDEILGHLFTEVMKTQLTEYLPIIYDFWESVLFHIFSFGFQAEICVAKSTYCKKIFSLDFCFFSSRKRKSYFML